MHEDSFLELLISFEYAVPRAEWLREGACVHHVLVEHISAPGGVNDVVADVCGRLGRLQPVVVVERAVGTCLPRELLNVVFLVRGPHTRDERGGLLAHAHVGVLVARPLTPLPCSQLGLVSRHLQAVGGPRCFLHKACAAALLLAHLVDHCRSLDVIAAPGPLADGLRGRRNLADL